MGLGHSDYLTSGCIVLLVPQFALLVPSLRGLPAMGGSHLLFFSAVPQNSLIDTAHSLIIMVARPKH